MLTALMHSGKVVTAAEYNPNTHGNRIYCIDKACKVPVIHVSKGGKEAHFKTTGKLESKHNPSCGFYEPLDVISAIKKVSEYQDELLNGGLKELIIRLNMLRIDPEYEPRQIEKKEKEEDDGEKEEKIKASSGNEQSSTISSVKSVAKLLMMHEPDVLASILLNIGGGRKVPLSSLIVNQEVAHELLWSDCMLKNSGYFVFGKIHSVLRREKVIYVTFEKVNDCPFTLVVFDKYFKYFTFTDEALIGQTVLCFGHLRKNEYLGKNTTEMLIKSNKYIERLHVKKRLF